MENPIIADVRTQAYKEGIAEGIEIARQMLCSSLGEDIDSFGKACAHVDKLIWEKSREKVTFYEWLVC